MTALSAQNIWIKCFHDLVTDFIIYMPKMLKDLKTESLRSRSNVAYFSSLLELVGQLHGGPETLCESLTATPNEFLATLTLEFWSPQEIMSGADAPALLVFEDDCRNWAVKSNDSYRQVGLVVWWRWINDVVGAAGHAVQVYSRLRRSVRPSAAVRQLHIHAEGPLQQRARRHLYLQFAQQQPDR